MIVGLIDSTTPNKALQKLVMAMAAYEKNRGEKTLVFAQSLKLSVGNT